MTRPRRPAAASWAAAGAVLVELAAIGRGRPEETLCPDLRAAFCTHTPAGKAAFVLAWVGFSAWLVPHVLNGPTEAKR